MAVTANDIKRELKPWILSLIQAGSGTPGPYIAGSGVANQVAYFTGTYTLAGDTGLTYNPTTNVLTLLNTSNLGLNINAEVYGSGHYLEVRSATSGRYSVFKVKPNNAGATSLGSSFEFYQDDSETDFRRMIFVGATGAPFGQKNVIASDRRGSPTYLPMVFRVGNAEWFDLPDLMTLTPNLVTITDAIQFGLTPTATPGEGKMYWNADDGTLNLGMPGGNVNLQLGQEGVIRTRNESGSSITNGRVVYITGASGNKPLIALAKADALNTSNPPKLFVATETIGNNSNGYCTEWGFVRDIDTSAFAPATVVYLSASTAGALTDTPPAPPNEAVAIGVIIKQHATEGILYVHIESPSGGTNGVTWAHASKSANYTLTTSDAIITVTAACTMTLPAANANTGRVYKISAEVDGVIVDDIEGANFTLLAGESIDVYSTGTEWRV